MKQNEREVNPGKEWAQRLKPGGCILVLVLTVLCMAQMLTAGPKKIDGYVPPESDAYYAQHLTELQTELETNVFPELEGVQSSEVADGVLKISIDKDCFITTRAAILQYYGQTLFEFVEN